MGVVLEPTNMFCWDTGSNTCSSQWLDLVHIKPPFFWRLLSGADLHGTPLHTALSGTSVWQKLPCPFLQCTWPVKTDMKVRLCPSSRLQHSTQFTVKDYHHSILNPVCDQHVYVPLLFTLFPENRSTHTSIL